MIREPHLDAELTLVRTEEGGRQAPAFVGYRPQFRYSGRDNDVFIFAMDRDRLSPGESASVQLTFFRPELQRGRLKPGTDFELAEGARVIARGKILAVLDDELASSDHPESQVERRTRS